jgi:hypothetical protein
LRRKLKNLAETVQVQLYEIANDYHENILSALYYPYISIDSTMLWYQENPTSTFLIFVFIEAGLSSICFFLRVMCMNSSQTDNVPKIVVSAH